MRIKPLFTLQKNNDAFLFTSSVPLQILIGLFSGVLNYIVCIKSVSSFFMDTVFVTFASCFGYASGMISAVVHYFLSYVGRFSEIPLHILLFFICMVSVTFVIRLYFRKKSRCTFTDILIVYLLIVLVVSFSGAVIAFLLGNKYYESASLSTTVLAFLRGGTNRLLAYLFARIPNNLVDKAISMTFGFGGFLLVRKVWEKRQDKKKHL